MLPVQTVRLELGNLLAADTTTLAPTLANKIALIMAPFVPSETLTLAGLTLATFGGNSPIAASTGAQEVGTDPLTGDQLITIKPVAGGWRWITTTLANLPQTIYGFALIDNAGAVLLATALLDTPLPLTTTGQVIDLGSVTITFVQQPMS